MYYIKFAVKFSLLHDCNIFHQICLNIHVINSLRAAFVAIQLQLTEINS